MQGGKSEVSEVSDPDLRKNLLSKRQILAALTCNAVDQKIVVHHAAISERPAILWGKQEQTEQVECVGQKIIWAIETNMSRASTS